MNMLLRDKVKRFLEITEINKTVFCKRADISSTSLNSWLKGERELSIKSENRLINYMTDYTKKLIEISK